MMTFYRVICLLLLAVGGGAWIFPNCAFSRCNHNSRALTLLASTESRSGGIDPEAIARIRAASLNKQRELKESATVVEGLAPPDPSTKKKKAAAKKKSSTPRKRKTPEEKEAEINRRLEKDNLEMQKKQLQEESVAAKKAAREEAKIREDVRARELHQAKLLYNYTDSKGNASTIPFIKASKWYAIKVPTGFKAQTLEHLQSKIISSSDHPLRGLITDAVLEYMPVVAMHRTGVLKNTMHLDLALAKNDNIFIRSSIMHPKIVKTLEQEKIPDTTKTISFVRNEGFIVPISAGSAQDIIDSANIENFAELSEKLSQITVGSYVTMDDYQPDEILDVDEFDEFDEFDDDDDFMYFGRVNGVRNGKLDLQLIINDEETLQRLYYPLDQVSITSKKPSPKVLNVAQKVALEKKLKSRARKLKLSHISTYKELDSALFDGMENTDLQLQIDDGSIVRFFQDDFGDWDINDRRQLQRFVAVFGFEHPFLRSFVKTQLFTEIMQQRGSQRIFEKYLVQYDPDYYVREERAPRRGSNTREYDENRLANREIRQFDKSFSQNNARSNNNNGGGMFDENVISNLVKSAAQKAMFTVEKNYDSFDKNREFDDFASVWGSNSSNKKKGGGKGVEESNVFEEDFSFLDDLIPSSDDSKASSSPSGSTKKASSSSAGSSIDDFFDDDFVSPPSLKSKSKAVNMDFSLEDDESSDVSDEVDDLLGLLEEKDDEEDDFLLSSPSKPVVKATIKPTVKPAVNPTAASNRNSEKKWKPKDTNDMSIDDFLDSFTSSSPAGQVQDKSGDNRLDSLISELDDMLGDRTNLNFNFNEATQEEGFDVSKLFPNNPRGPDEPEQDYEDFMKQLEREFSGMDDFRLDLKNVDLISSSPASSQVEEVKAVKKPRAAKKPASSALGDDSAVDTRSDTKKKPTASKRSKKSTEE